MKDYNIVSYWNERENPCSNQIDQITPNHLRFIETQCKDDKLIMDFGPGTGRIFSAYPSGITVIGVDVTNNRLDKLNENAKKNNIEFHLQVKTDILSLFDINDNYYDSVVASEVFLHQTPDIIESIMDELIRISKKVVVITYLNISEKYDELDKPYDKGRYCFNYNYYEIAKKNNWSIYNAQRVRNQLMFVYKEV